MSFAITIRLLFEDFSPSFKCIFCYEAGLKERIGSIELMMKLRFLWFFLCGCYFNRGLCTAFARRRRWTRHAPTDAASSCRACVPIDSYIVYSSSLILCFKICSIHFPLVCNEIVEASSNSTSIRPHFWHHLWEKQYVVVLVDRGDFKGPHSRLHIIVRIVVVSVMNHLAVYILLGPYLWYLVHLTCSAWDLGMDCLRYFAIVIHVFSIIAAWRHRTASFLRAYFDNENLFALSHGKICNCLKNLTLFELKYLKIKYP